jgi:hypothetical protein
MFKVRFVNHGFSSEETFATVTEAVKHGLKVRFEFAVDEVGGNCVAAWGTFSGLRFFDEARREEYCDAMGFQTFVVMERKEAGC